MPTIRDVAEKAGVSPGTVSRVLNQRGWVSPQTCERVQRAIKDLEYRPNRMARNLRLGASHMVGLLFCSPDSTFEHAFFSEILLGVGRELERNSYSMVVSTVWALQCTAQPPALMDVVDGIIVAGMAAPGSLYPQLRKAKVPIVVIGQHFPDKPVSRVRVNNAESTSQAVDELVAIGKRNLALMTGSRRMYAFMDVVRGFRAACERHGIVCTEDRIIEVEEASGQGGLDAVKHLLETHKELDGIVVGNVALTAGVARYVREQGISIPDEIGIMGYGDRGVVETADPPFPLIWTDGRQLGLQAVRLLLDELEGARHPVAITIDRYIRFPSNWPGLTKERSGIR